MLRWHSALACITLSLVACDRNSSPNDKSAESAKASPQPKRTDDDSTGSRQGQASPEPQGDPVKTGPPNVPELKPAFPAQTRAPELDKEVAIEVTKVADGFALPWALAFLPDGRMLVTEKHAGKLSVVTDEGQKSAPVEGVPKVDAGGQGGLLDVALGPDFPKSQLVYLSYYEPRPGGNGLAVARARLIDDEEKPKLENLEVIFRMKPTLESDKHAGGRLAFSPKGNLFVTLGDRSVMAGRKQARDLSSHFGKIVRIEPDGSAPKDNPFVGKKDTLPEIWTLGHRNVLGADFDAKGQLWVVEMGPQGGDELNLIERGEDYGWPKIGYGEEYSGEPIHESAQAPGLEQPVYYWDPVISPGALLIYSGDLFSEWKGDFLIAGLSSRALVRLEVRDNRVIGEDRLLTDRNERMREVVQGPKGAVYLLTDSGDLLKLTPKDT